MRVNTKKCPKILCLFLCVLPVALSNSVSYASISAVGSFLPTDSSQWNSGQYLYIAVEDDAILTIDNGSDLYSSFSSIGCRLYSYNMGYIGRVTVTGSGSTWTCSSTLAVGMGGTGVLNITSGGTVTTVDTHIGANQVYKSGTGSIVIDGSGSKLTCNGELSVGNTSTGSLSLSHGAAATTSTVCSIGYESGVTGTVTIDGSGSSFNSGGALVGVYGTGTLNLTNGGKMTLGNSTLFSIGHFSGSQGTLTVDGINSTLSYDYAGVIGYEGSAALNIINGGKVSDYSSMGSVIGFQQNSTGNVLVDGTGSTWTISNRLTVGNFGTGNLTISYGGLVKADTLWIAPSLGMVKMSNGGRLALKGQAADSINTFLALIYGSHVIYGWDPDTNSWKDITSLTRGKHYTLTYQTSGSLAGFTVLTFTGSPIAGDANLDGQVDVGDLGVLAANYGKTSGATWSTGDFNGDSKVDVGDLGILAANYGFNASCANLEEDSAKVVDVTTNKSSDTAEDADGALCSGMGLSLIAGLFWMGLMLARLED
jgi:T5SS/PEP-CTERM-associated repeat protein